MSRLQARAKKMQLSIKVSGASDWQRRMRTPRLNSLPPEARPPQANIYSLINVAVRGMRSKTSLTINGVFVTNFRAAVSIHAPSTVSVAISFFAEDRNSC